MTRITFRWGPSLLLLVPLVTGCVSFASVKQTAKLGEQLSSQENVFDTAPVLCRIERQKENNADSSICDQLEQDLVNWHKVNRSLVAYAKALDAMADDSKEKSYKDDVSTMLGAASKVGPWSTSLGSKNVTDGISKGVDALITLITNLYRRAELKLAIKNSDDHIHNIATGIELEIDVLNASAIDMQREATTNREVLNKDGREQVAMRLTYLQWWMSVGTHRSELGNYKKAIAAFAKAHRDLKEHINSVGGWTADVEVLQEITKDAYNILTGTAEIMKTSSK